MSSNNNNNNPYYQQLTEYYVPFEKWPPISSKTTSSTSNEKPWKRKPTGNSNNDDDDDDDEHNNNIFGGMLAATNITTGLALKALTMTTVALYIMNQAHMLPRPISALVSKALFYPTLPITVSKRIGQWTTRIDDTVVIGGAPFGFCNYPEKLKESYGVKGVINLCAEYRGPLKKYSNLGMEELYLPTTDHFVPEVDDMISAVSFIKRHQAKGNRVYVHCRAGHGRSAAIVFAWLLYKDPIVDPKSLNQEFCKLRNVRSTLWKQPNIQKFHERLKTKGTILLNTAEEEEDSSSSSASQHQQNGGDAGDNNPKYNNNPTMLDDVSSGEEEEAEEEL